MVFLNAGFLTDTFCLASELTPLASLLAVRTPVAELGVPLDALEKKLKIDPFLVDPALEVCFMVDEGAGVSSDLSFLTIAAGRYNNNRVYGAGLRDTNHT